MYRILIVCYAAISHIIFNTVFETAPMVIDEEFHVPQGIQYCNFNFSTWDPKITTLPGLYIISAIVLGPLNLCSVYCLRYISFVAGFVNLALFFIIMKNVHKTSPKNKLWLSSVNISLLPPLFFFNNFYYTDVVSLTSILVMFALSLENKHFLASVAGFVTILMRQTNVVWVAFIFGRYLLNNYFHHCLKANPKTKSVKVIAITEEDIKNSSLKDLKNVFSIQNLPTKVCVNLSYYIILLLGFVAFVIQNEGIVVGDKTAHAAVIHIPQVFYFSLFCLIFSWPYMISSIIPFLKFVFKNKLFVAVTLVLMVIAVHYNTLTHPYLLADNRHYTFYVWKRFYEKVFVFRYVMVVPYIFAFFSIIKTLYSARDTAFVLLYVVCTTFVLILQRMIEVRYFLIPFVLFRLNLRNANYKTLVVESIFYIVINGVTLRQFFIRNIYWAEYDYPQKLMW